MGRSTLRSSKEERHTGGHGIPVRFHKRRHGDTTSAAQRFQTRRTAGLDRRQRDSGISPARGVDLPNIAQSREQTGGP